MLANIYKSLDLLRWNEWYDSKLPLITACAYELSLRRPMGFGASTFKMFTALLFYASFVGFGYLLNDYCDWEVDCKAGKRRGIHSLSKGTAVAILVGLFVGGWLALLPYREAGLQLAIILGFSYLVNISYSLRPLRLKERGLAGLISASVAQRALPILVFGIIWKDLGWAVLGWSTLGFLVGLRYILIHQQEDLLTDRESGVKTFASKHLAILPALMRIIFVSEIFDLLGVLISIAFQNPLFYYYIGLVGLYLIGYLTLYNRYIGKPSLFSYVYVPLEEVYSILLPIGLLLLLIKVQPLWALFLPVEIAWKRRCIKQYMTLPYKWFTRKFLYKKR